METNLEEFAGISDPPVYSRSKESLHGEDLILVMNKSSIYRISAAHQDGKHKFVKTKLFKVRILQDIKYIEVYDEFAFIIFEDESAMVAFRPKEEGGIATYNNKTTDVGGEKRGLLNFSAAPIQYFNIVKDDSQQYSYILNILTQSLKKDKETKNYVQYLSQQWISIEDDNAFFIELKKPEVPDSATYSISSIDSNSLITVVGYESYNEGKGLITVMDSQSLDLLYTIDGLETKQGVGKQVQIQEDRQSNGYRIWYSTKDKLIAASYAKFGSEVIFDDEI